MSNPVLVNDLRRSWFRRRPVHTVALMAVLILALTLLVAAGMPAALGLTGGGAVFWRLPDLMLPVIAPIFAAGAFAREHEQRTWQDILLTPLSASEIVAGKFFASFLPAMATVIILMPPFALILILSGVQWAQEPGFWMVAFIVRFVLSAVFYLAVGLVCSYHSANARNALIVGYTALGLYATASWGVAELFSLNGVDAVTGAAWSSGPMQVSAVADDQLGFSGHDVLFLAQGALLCVALFGYLLFRVSHRRLA